MVGALRFGHLPFICTRICRTHLSSVRPRRVRRHAEATSSDDEGLNGLLTALNLAIANENYDEAATLRDTIQVGQFVQYYRKDFHMMSKPLYICIQFPVYLPSGHPRRR